MEYFNRQGEVITPPAFYAQAQMDNTVRKSDVYGVHISTVFLNGLDHSFGHGPPLLFETMLFPQWNYDGEWQWRWTTEENAVRGHEAIEKEIRKITGWRAIFSLWFWRNPVRPNLQKLMRLEMPDA